MGKSIADGGKAEVIGPVLAFQQRLAFEAQRPPVEHGLQLLDNVAFVLLARLLFFNLLVHEKLGQFRELGEQLLEVIFAINVDALGLLNLGGQ